MSEYGRAIVNALAILQLIRDLLGLVVDVIHYLLERLRDRFGHSL